MKHEKYFTFDGEIEVWPVDEVHIAAMAHLTDKALTHRRRIPQEDGSILGLATYRSNKDEHLTLFKQLNVPGFTEILPGTPEEKHGKHSWDKHDAEKELEKFDRRDVEIIIQEGKADIYIIQLDETKFRLQGEKEQAILSGDDKLKKETQDKLDITFLEISKTEVWKVELQTEKNKNEEKRIVVLEKRSTAENALLELGS